MINCQTCVPNRLVMGSSVLESFIIKKEID